MKPAFAIIVNLLFPLVIFSQQQFSEIKPCGGSSYFSLQITDNDSDGLDDGLEQILLEKFMPVFIRFDDDDCPGPSPSGSTTIDTNIVVCRIFPVPPQFTIGINLQLLSENPVELAGEKNLKTGMVWYEPTLIANCALLYGKDCGLTGHTADVEGFTFTLQYTGGLEGGWRFDTILSHWKGIIIQTVSHAGTLCEKIETLPRLSIDFPNGSDTIFASPDKHGNYLTIGKCNSGFLCDPSCNNTKLTKKIKAVNVGEENDPLVTDLGIFNPEYLGENPWGTAKFLESIGGNAGTIKDKMLKELTAELIKGKLLDSCYKICDMYDDCFNCGNISYSDCVFSCDTVQPDSGGSLIPLYKCSVFISEEFSPSPLKIFPNPSNGKINIIGILSEISSDIAIADVTGRIIFSGNFTTGIKELNLQNTDPGVYYIIIKNPKQFFIKKIIVVK